MVVEAVFFTIIGNLLQWAVANRLLTYSALAALEG